MPGTYETETIAVRRLKSDDLEPVIALDAKITGRRRSEYFKLKLDENLRETGILVSLAAELDRLFVGFLLARVYYGEFGVLEPVAVLDTFGVHPDFRRRGVGRALLDQLCTDLRGLNVTMLQTEVGWDNLPLMNFFQYAGFRPAPRFCLNLDPFARHSDQEMVG